MRSFLAGALLGTLAGTLGTIMVIRRKGPRKKVPARAPASAKVSLDDIIGGEPEAKAAQLRQSLLVKFMFDEEKIERAIAYERERQPQASLEDHLQAAIERWERDNR